MKYVAWIILAWWLLGCQNQDNHHTKLEHNFTVKRLIILNDQQEILLGQEDGLWFTPSMLYTERQHINEGLDSMANAYGVKIDQPKLHGYFSYKYDYHPYATLRAFYVARFESGQLKIPGHLDDVQWFPLKKGIELTPVESMKKAIEAITGDLGKVWGGSFEVYVDGDKHNTRVVENLYPLFDCKQ